MGVLRGYDGVDFEGFCGFGFVVVVICFGVWYDCLFSIR